MSCAALWWWCGPMSRGNYIVLPHKAPNFILPEVDLAAFPLKPYVAKLVPKKPELMKAPPGAAYSTLARRR